MTFHGRARYRRAARVSSAAGALAVLLFSAACAKKDDVTAPILRGVKAVEDRDADAFAGWLARGYHDAEHADPASAAAHVRQLGAGYDALKIDVSRLAVEDLGTSRRARFRAELSGTPKNVGGFDAFLPRRSAWDFETSLVYEGGRWRIATASWKPAE